MGSGLHQVMPTSVSRVSASAGRSQANASHAMPGIATPIAIDNGTLAITTATVRSSARRAFE